MILFKKNGEKKVAPFSFYKYSLLTPLLFLLSCGPPGDLAECTNLYMNKNRTPDWISKISDKCGVDQIDAERKSILYYSVLINDYRGAKKLLSKGAKVQYDLEDPNLVIERAIYNGRIEMFELLISYTSDLNRQGFSGKPPIMIAAEHADVEFVKVLLRKKASLDIIDKQGRNVLFYAAKGGNYENYCLALKNGAAPNLVDHKGKTALDYVPWVVKKTFLEKTTHCK